MDLQDEARSRGRARSGSRRARVRLVVPTSRRRAPALAQDVRDAEGAADLHQLAAAHQHLAALRERVDGEQHGGGVVVHDRGGFDAQQARSRDSACTSRSPALAADEVELQVRVGGGDLGHARARRGGRAGARPRLVWTTTPVALITRHQGCGRDADSSRSAKRSAERPREPSSSPSSSSASPRRRGPLPGRARRCLQDDAPWGAAPGASCTLAAAARTCVDRREPAAEVGARNLRHARTIHARRPCYSRRP